MVTDFVFVVSFLVTYVTCECCECYYVIVRLCWSDISFPFFGVVVVGDLLSRS